MTNKTSSETAREEELSKIISPKKDRVALDGSLYSFHSVRPFVHTEWYQNRYDLSLKEINQWRTAWREYLEERFSLYFDDSFGKNTALFLTQESVLEGLTETAELKERAELDGESSYGKYLSEDTKLTPTDSCTPEEYKKERLEEPFHLQHIRMSTSDKEIYPLEARQKSEPIAHLSVGEDELLRAIRRNDYQGIEDAFNERFSS